MNLNTFNDIQKYLVDQVLEFLTFHSYSVEQYVYLLYACEKLPESKLVLNRWIEYRFRKSFAVGVEAFEFESIKDFFSVDASKM